MKWRSRLCLASCWMQILCAQVGKFCSKAVSMATAAIWNWRLTVRKPSMQVRQVALQHNSGCLLLTRCGELMLITGLDNGLLFQCQSWQAA